jgi:cellulose synthase/poly-beta-1,6-N-acetylglucosamine synthase-like glycosyltransferase/peptidoglycan/xylan/chitin deacetylase (PgdA/CDA1 family)
VVGLVGLACVASLFVAGYTHRLIGDAGTGPTGAAARTALPAGAGPVLTFGPGGRVQTQHLRPGAMALTFDDGPDPKWTPQILRVLREERVPATFFVVGSRVLDHPGLVRDEVRSGNAVGVHTFTHIDLTSHSVTHDRIELSLTEKAIAAAAGVTSSLLRPPYSSEPDAVTPADLARWQRVARAFHVVLATRDSEDWQRPGVARIVRNALPPAGGTPGTVVMFHDGGGNRGETVAALKTVIRVARAHGYHFVTVPAAIGKRAMAPASRTTRFEGDSLLLAERTAVWLSLTLGICLLILTVLSVLRAVLMIAVANWQRRREASQDELPMAFTPSVSAIVPAFNEEVGIAGTVLSLARSDYPRLEIIVVDDGSTDGTVGMVEALMGRVESLRLIRQWNCGKARALNRGIAASTGDILVLIDGDTVVEPDTISRLIAPFIDPGVGAVSGNAKVGNRRGFLGRWQHIEYVMGFNLDRRLFDLTNCMQTVPGAIGAFRRDVLRATGGVPTATLAEDTDLTITIGLLGWRIAYQGTARAWTEAPSTLRGLWRQRYRWAYGTMQAAWKHRRAIGGRAVTGPGGATTHLGRVGLPYLLVFGVLLPLLGPLVDVFTVVGLVFTSPVETAVMWTVFNGIQFGLAAYALKLDGERVRTLWALPFQQIVYRQVMYLVVLEAMLGAVTGRRLHWNKLPRKGSAADALQGASTRP